MPVSRRAINARRATLYTNVSVMRYACVCNARATARNFMLMPGGDLLDHHPSGAPINYQPEWQTPTHTKVPELVRRFTSSLGAGSFRMNGARSKNVRMFVFVMPKGTLLNFLLFFLCEAPNRKVE